MQPPTAQKTSVSRASGVPGTAAGAVTLSASQASRTLMVLGLLTSGPRHGYELHRIVVAHGSLYADFKKPTLYHLLHRLTGQGAVEVHSEGGARGPRGERLVFALTPAGEEQFRSLLRQALSSYETEPTLFVVAAAFLMMLPADEAQGLLEQRRAAVRARRAEMQAEMDVRGEQPAAARLAARQLATGHALHLMDAEIGWLDRVIGQLAAGNDQRFSTTRTSEESSR